MPIPMKWDVVVQKQMDSTSPFVFDKGHTSGVNTVLCDGSVRSFDGQDDPNLLLPAVSDPNLLLPAVTDPHLLLPYSDFDIV